MMQAFNQLSFREKIILVFAATALLFLSIHAFLWQPIMDDAANYQEQLEQEKDDLIWIQQNIIQLKNNSVKPKKIKGSFISWLDLQINKRQLKNSLKRIKPRGNRQVKIWMEEASVKNLMQLLSEITQYTVQITEIKLVALDEPGIINVTITLENQ